MRLTLFISSPGDVGEERRIAGRVLERLGLEFTGRAALEPLFWEHEPLRATASFQEQLPLPSECDVVVVILWSRLGTRLPSHLVREDGSTYASGTEFEFEDAARAFEARGVPDLLVYRKTARPVTPLDSEAEVLERLRQKQALDSFVERWFQGTDGSFRAAFHAFDDPAAFEEQLESHLRRLVQHRLAERAEQGETVAAAPLWTKGSPFRGLQAFEYEHATVFCGRTRAVSEVLDRLRRQAAEDRAFTLVLGMSGCGKSSLARAGVMPHLTQPGVIEGIGLWRRAILRPSDAEDPFRALAAALLAEDALPELGLGTTAEDLARDLRSAPSAVGTLVRQTLAQAAAKVQADENLEAPPEPRLALLVDQLEELFSDESLKPADRAAFVEALSVLARGGRTWILATLRSDFYDRCSEIPELLALKEGAGQYDLLPPTPAEIAQIIRLPSRMAGLTFEADPETDAPLDDVLRDAAAKDPEALPLLEFALDALFERRSEEGRLTFEAYGGLGGLEGALAGRAEETYLELPEDVREAAPVVFESLVRFGLGDQDNPVKRRAGLAAAAPTPEARALVDAFVDARLFATDRAEDGSAEVALAHEALLRRWPRLRDWVDANRESLRARARVAAAAAIWTEEEESPDHLLSRGHLLDEGLALLEARRDDLAPEEIRFLEASRARVARRRRTRLASGGVLALLVLVAAFLGWRHYDANVRLHVDYVGETAHRWGVPEAVTDTFDAEELSQRGYGLRMHHRGGQVLKVEAVRGDGSPRPEHEGGSLITRWDPDAGTQRECVWEYRYFADGAVSDEIASNQYGQVVHHLRFPQGHRGQERIVAQYVKEGLPSSQSPSGAAFVELTRDDRGFLARMRYLDHQRRMLPNAHGSYGEAWETDDRGRILRVTHLGPEGEPAVDRRGVARVETTRDGEGRPRIVAFLDSEGNPVIGPDGFCTSEIEYDAHSRPVRVIFYGAGERVNTTYGWSRIDRTYDDRGLLAREAYFDKDDAPLAAAWGPAAVQMTRNERGDVVRWEYFDAAGELAWGGRKAAAAVLELEVDEWGNLTHVRYLGPDGEPVAHPQGNHAFAAEYDERGNRIVGRYLDRDGNPTPVESGYAVTRMRYDDANRLVEMAYFDAEDRPVRSDQGFAIQRETRDYRGNLSGVTYHHADGSSARSAFGNAAFDATYDDFGNRVEERYLDQAGEPYRLVEGHVGLKMRYDERNRLVETVWIDADGSPATTVGGYARRTDAHDDRGHVVESRFFDAEGRPVPGDGGVHLKRMEVDPFGNALVVRHFDVSGEPTTDNHGVAVARSVFDDRNDEISRRLEGLDGEPVVHGDDGDAGWDAEVDALGRPRRTVRMGPDGEPGLTAHGTTEVRWRHDDRGRLLEVAHFDGQGRPATVDEGFSIVRFERDARGGVARVAYFGPGGEPVLHRSGHHVRTRRFDAHGEIVETAWFGVDGAPLPQAEGYTAWRATYDDRGNLVRKVFLAGNGDPTVDVRGAAGFAQRHDEADRMVEKTWLDEQGKPTVNAEGYAIRREHYDEDGHLRRTTHHDARGEPVLLADGSHGMAYEVDARGRRTSVTWIDVDGKPTPSKDGYAALVRKIDARGLPLREEYGDGAGGPMPSVDGDYGLEHVYEDTGRWLSFTWLGPDGRPRDGRLGHATTRWSYDARGSTIRERYLDVEGRPVLSTQLFAGFDATHDPYGRETRRVRVDAAGEPTWGYDGYVTLETSYDRWGRPVTLRHLDAAGGLVRTAAGYAVAERTYDDRGHLVAERFLDEAGALVTSEDGYPRRTRRVDHLGRWIEEQRYDMQDRPILPAQVLTRDAYGRVLRETFVDAAGEPVDGPGGYAAVVHAYDRFGRRISTHWESAAGRRVDAGGGMAEIRYAHDARGFEVERTFHDADGRRIAGNEGHAGWTTRVDRWGRVLETVYRDAQGEPVAPPGKPAISRFTRDAWGRETSASVFDAQGRPVAEPSGIHARQRAYDEAGHLAEERTLDAEGALRVDPATGRARTTFVNDARGNRLEERFFDGDDRPVRMPGGGALIRYGYDGQDRQTEVAHFDEAEQPIDVPALGGGHKVEIGYDDAGRMRSLRWRYRDGRSHLRRFDGAERMVERSFFDAEGQPEVGPPGFARQTYAYDEAGVVTGIRYYDAAGAEVDPGLEVVVALVSPDSPAARAGIEAGDVLVRYDGKRVNDEVALSSWTSSGGSGPRPVELRRGEATVLVEVPPGPMGVSIELRPAP